MSTHTRLYPEFLALPLMRGDLSRLEDHDLPLLDAVCRDLAPCRIVDCMPWGEGSIRLPFAYTGKLAEFTVEEG